MEKRDICLIIIIFASLLYLAFLLNSQPLIISANSTLNFPENTPVQIIGTPEAVKAYNEGISFYIGKINIRLNSIKSIKNENVTVRGKVSTYNNSTYVEGLKINYGN